jgi:hypothetical protein
MESMYMVYVLRLSEYLFLMVRIRKHIFVYIETTKPDITQHDPSAAGVL